MLKNLILLSGFSTFAVLVIVGFNIYHGLTLSSLPPTTQTRVIPIPPTFDKDTIEELRKRTSIPVNLQEKTAVVSDDSQSPNATTPTPSVNPTQIQASGSASTL